MHVISRRKASKAKSEPRTIETSVSSAYPAEPRARDIDIATRAGLAQPRDVRRIIERNIDELSAHGALSMRAHSARIEKHAGKLGTPVVEERTVNEYWLNEAQSVALISMKPSNEVQQ